MADLAVRVTQDRFDPGTELNAFLHESEGAGAAVTFTGVVRSSSGQKVDALVLESYPELAINQIEVMVETATIRFGLLKVDVIHRYGRMMPGEPIVQVMTLAPHRAAAFEGAEFLMDYLKTEAPFWKQETTPDGTNWVEARSEDDAARLRWE